MTDAGWPTDTEVARLREVYFAPREIGISDLGIRLLMWLLSPSLIEEARCELARPDADPLVLDPGGRPTQNLHNPLVCYWH